MPESLENQFISDLYTSLLHLSGAELSSNLNKVFDAIADKPFQFALQLATQTFFPQSLPFVSAGIAALWGPLHGGANQAVIEMLEEIKADGGDVDKYVAKAIDKSDAFRLMGFGHRVYKNFDPRALIIKKAADDVLTELGIEDPILDIAMRLEQVALKDEYFKTRSLYPNVDFYSGIIYRALGIPTDMFTVIFAMGRLPGWIAQWKEMRENGEPIGRPRQVYFGATERAYVNLENR